MRNKKLWLAAILIISLLAITFICGGNYNGGSTGYEESSTETQAVNNTASSQTTEAQQNEEYNVQASANAGKFDEIVSGTGTKETTKVLADKSAEVKKSATGTDKVQETEVIKIQEVEPSQKVNDAASAKSKESKPEKTSSNQEDKKDKYLTDPVPEGKPKPVEWQETTINKDKILSCTLSVTCKTILDNMNKFNKDKLEVLPEDGIIFKTQVVTFTEGESVFDVLLREMKKNKIHMEFEMTPIYNSNYIEGMHNLYEFDCGELSGWMYKVNGWFPNYGCSRYMLKDGDVIEWIYTCDLGRDIGGGMAVGGEG